MDLQRSVAVVVVLVLVLSTSLVSAGDIVHQDNIAPKRPGCENNFVLVKVPTWINGIEGSEYVGVGARFGPTLESKEKRANHTRVVLADPPDCCKTQRKLSGEVILVHRGTCSFTDKANFAEAANASAVLVINYHTELFKMVCENESDTNISIPTVMLPQDAGTNLENDLKNNLTVIHNILSEWDDPDGTLHSEGVGSSGYVDINTTAAVLFVVIASCFLIMLYKLMSLWFLEVLVVLFCIGGVEGLQTCLVALLS
ncbi:hypothetical protein FEM48_Zijuj12G0162200 [Ziziphus jujuba var. spinosa]|uniref:PA domain-containing protein n=1 Tax=Ziziphus jujuba var. spinosa TaxID=714518 RepID=A0A978UEC0_ZIZJJ|nr:hypothetical protein FEM48_Zijuj12G0162200 [Ziziphus jujuba var. spinosa]